MKRSDVKRLQAWATKATTGVADSAVFMSLWNDTMNAPAKEPEAVLQLAYALILDKPIVIVAQHGATIPPKVRRIADALEFYDRGDEASLRAATLRALAAVGLPTVS